MWGEVDTGKENNYGDWIKHMGIIVSIFTRYLRDILKNVSRKLLNLNNSELEVLYREDVALKDNIKQINFLFFISLMRTTPVILDFIR